MMINKHSDFRRKARLIGSRLVFFGLIGIITTQSVFGADPRLFEATQLDSQRSLYNSWNAGPGPGAVKNGYVFETDPESGILKVINTNTPTPTFEVARGAYMHGAYAATLVGDYVYVTASGDGGTNPARLYVYSAVDLGDVHQVNSILLGSISSIGLTGCNWSELLQGGQALPGGLAHQVGCVGGQRIAFLDLQDPLTPVFSDYIDVSTYFTSIESLQSVGNTMYVYSSQQLTSTLYLGITTADLSNVFISENGDGSAFTIYGTTAQYRENDRLYLVGSPVNANPRDDLYTIDVSNPAALTIIDQNVDAFSVDYGYDGRTIGIVPGGHMATYLDDEIATISLADPDAPIVAGTSGAFWSGQFIGVDQSGYMYLGDGKYNQTTLQVFDVSSGSSAPSLLEAKTTDLYRGYTSKVLVPAGSTTALIVTNGGPVVRRVDISDPNNMRHIDDQNLLDGDALLDNFTFSSVSDVTLSSDGRRMYIVSAKDFGTSYTGGTLLVFDIEDTSDIQLLSKTTLPEEPIKANIIDGSNWYILTENSLRSYDINDATGVVTALDSTTYTRPVGSDGASGTRIVSIVNDQALLLFGAQQVLSVDVADPSNMSAAATVSLPTMASYTNISYPYVVGTTAFIVSRTGTTNCRVYALNAANTASMSIRSSTAHDSVFCSPVDEQTLQPRGASQLFYSPPSGDSIASITIADHDAISLSGKPGPSHQGLFNEASDGFANLFSYTLVGDTVYGVSDIGDSNMYAVDVSNITVPRPLDVLTGQIPFYQAFTLKHFGGHLYVGGNDQDESDSDFSSFSLADPDMPKYVGTTVHDYSAVYSIERKDSYMYTTRNWGGLGVYDATNPEFPVPIRLIDELTTALDMKVSGDYLYVADQSNGLMIYDITDPANPVQLSSYTDVNFSGLDSIAIVGNVLYGISDGDNKVMVLDISDPNAPTTTMTLTDPEFDQLSKVLVSDDTLYVSGRGDGITSSDSVTAYDISTVSTPSKMGQYIAPLATLGYGSMEVHQGFLLVAASTVSRIDVIDFDDVANPTLATSIIGDTSLEGVNDIEVVGDRLYTISRLGQGLNTYRLTVATGNNGGTVTPPTIPVTDPVFEPPTPGAPNAGTTRSISWLSYLLPALIFMISAAYCFRKEGRLSRSLKTPR